MVSNEVVVAGGTSDRDNSFLVQTETLDWVWP